MNRIVLAVVLLTVLYATVLARFDLPDLVFAMTVSVLLLFGLRRFLFDGLPGSVASLSRRCSAFLPFAAAVLLEIVIGTWQVVLVVVGRRSAEDAGMVSIDVGDRTPTGIAVSALVNGLSPGTVAVEAAEGIIVFHVLDASDPDAVRARYQHLYQRYQKRVFP